MMMKIVCLMVSKMDIHNSHRSFSGFGEKQNQLVRFNNKYNFVSAFGMLVESFNRIRITYGNPEMHEMSAVSSEEGELCVTVV